MNGIPQTSNMLIALSVLTAMFHQRIHLQIHRHPCFSRCVAVWGRSRGQKCQHLFCVWSIVWGVKNSLKIEICVFFILFLHLVLSIPVLFGYSHLLSDKEGTNVFMPCA